MIRARKKLLIGAGGIAIIFSIFLRFRPSNDPIPFGSTNVNPTGPAMVPWRSPEADIATFFPGASKYALETVVLSRYRPEILRKLGPKYHMDSTAVYAYSIFKDGKPVGIVVPRRLSGIHGAIEIVVAIRPDFTVERVTNQRSRETEIITNSLFDGKTLNSFIGKNEDSSFAPETITPSKDPDVLATAQILGLISQPMNQWQ